MSSASKKIHLICLFNTELTCFVWCVCFLTADDDDPESDKPKVLWSLFFNQVDASECDDAVLAEGLASNAMVTAGPGTSVGFEHAVAQVRTIASNAMVTAGPGTSVGFEHAVAQVRTIASNAMVTAGPGTSVGFEHAVAQVRTS